jgi:hypothetical protein
MFELAGLMGKLFVKAESISEKYIHKPYFRVFQYMSRIKSVDLIVCLAFLSHGLKH